MIPVSGSDDRLDRRQLARMYLSTEDVPMRQPLHEEDDLEIWFAIDESTDEAFVEIESSSDGPDLSIEGDVVVAAGGTVAPLDVEGADVARARLGTWEELESEGLELMIRVGEWFESWELE